MTVRLFEGTKFVLCDAVGKPVCAPRPLTMHWRNGEAQNGALLLDAQGAATSWAIVKGQQVLDAGPLSRAYRLRRGDHVAFPRGAIKAAAVGDVLGITCVFMPSGFAVGVVPPTPAAVPGGYLGGTLGDFAYAGQDERTPGVTFWLPKRRWQEMPRYLGEYGTWQKRLNRPEVGVSEVVRRREQELVALGVI